MIPRAENQPTLSVREAAPLLGVSPATLFRAIAEDRSPVAFVKVGTRVQIITADLRRVLHLPDSPANGGDGCDDPDEPDDATVIAALERQLGAVVVSAHDPGAMPGSG